MSKRQEPRSCMNIVDKEAKKHFALALLTMLNDEVANNNAVFGSYSYNPYVKAASDEVQKKSMCLKMTEYMKNTPYLAVTAVACMKRSIVAGNVLGNNWLASEITARNYDISQIDHTVATINVPMDQLEANGIYMLPDGEPYNMIQIRDMVDLVEVEVDDEPSLSDDPAPESELEVTI